MKEESHRTSTKETYESIEKSTPIKKLAEEDEEEEEERVQVDFNLKVRQVKIECDDGWR